MGSMDRKKTAIVIGSGAGGAMAARELQGDFQVTILEAGGEFKPFPLSVKRMAKLRGSGLFFDERLIRFFLPNMKVEKTFGSVAEYNKKQGSDWVRDWPTVQRRATEGVALRKNGSVCFNKKNKNGLQICCSPATWKFYKSTKDTDEKASYDKHYVMVDPAKAKYKFVVTVSKIDMGSGAASAFGGMSTGGAIMTGTMKAVEIKTGKTLATFDIKECQGMGNFAQYIRLQMLFSTLMANGVLPLK